MQESVVNPEQAIEELIIRIDENNNIIGSTTRKEMVGMAHPRGRKTTGTAPAASSSIIASLHFLTIRKEFYI